MRQARLLEALKGVAIMLNTELEKYDNEPWAQRVRAAITTSEQEGRQPSWLYFCNKCWAVYEAVSEHSTCSRTPQRFLLYPVEYDE